MNPLVRILYRRFLLNRYASKKYTKLQYQMTLLAVTSLKKQQNDNNGREQINNGM